jgi:hypothetical protein
MFLSGVLFVLFLAGCWLYCLTDAALTPAAEFPWLRKPVWIAVIAVTFIVGAIAWVVARKLRRSRRWLGPAHPAYYQGAYYRTTGADAFLAFDALARHPASQARNTPERGVRIGPDDDPEFLRELAARIRGEQ